jgi:glyoxylase-like metal-dependent hydrolase (beta-lactamase superfamily II)
VSYRTLFFELYLSEGLEEVLDATLEEVDLAIVTDLHFDHVSNTNRCENARVIVQAKELEYALTPHPAQGYPYDVNVIRDLCCQTIDGKRENLAVIDVTNLPDIHRAHGPYRSTTKRAAPSAAACVP